MTLTVRRLLYLSFTLIFIIIAPLLVLYTAGYRFNWYKKGWEKTGSLIIETIPKTVDIKINEQIFHHRSTPLRLNHLLPNDYHIQISKDGYSSWEKTLTVYPGKATFAQDIYIFRQNTTSHPIATSTIDHWTYNPKLNIIVFQTNNKLWLYHLDNEHKQIITPFASPITSSSWSVDKSKLLITTPQALFIWTSTNPTTLAKIDANYSQNHCRWDQDNNYLIYCQTTKELWRYDLGTLKRDKIISFKQENLLDFYKKNNNFYYLLYNPRNKQTYLRIITLNTLSEPWPDFLLPTTPLYHFLNVNKDIVTIIDQKLNRIYQLNLNRQAEKFNRTSQIIKDATGGSYNSRGELLYFNDWEIWVLKQNNAQLITRQTDKIISAFWHPSESYLVIVTAQGIKIIELDDRDRRNATSFLTNESIKQATITKKGDYLIWQSQEKGLFTLPILPNDLDAPLPIEMP